MIRSSLVAINILDKNNRLLNKTGAPLLFYWDGYTDNILDDLSNNSNFIDYCNKLFASPENYLNIKLSYFYFKYSDNYEELYNEKTIDIQNVLKLDNFESDKIVNYFLTNAFKKLYSISFKEEYKKETDTDKLIIDIYNTLKEKFKNRIIKKTVVNWVRSVLFDTNNLTSDNTDFIINKLETILININD